MRYLVRYKLSTGSGGLWRIPSEGLYPERSLRQQLERIEDTNLKRASLKALDQLNTARQLVVQASGHANRLDQALGMLEATFTELTKTASTRNAGQTYAGRTLVYEDCRRNATLSLSPELIASLGPSLALLLASARWFSFKAAAIYRKAFREIYKELVQKTGSSTVEFSGMWMLMQSVLFGGDSRLVVILERELQKRWSSILKFTEQQHQATYTAHELRNEVLSVFNVPHPGWKAACYHSPDLMIAASSLDAIDQGDFQWVLGELHPTANTLNNAGILAQHPSGDELFRALETDIPLPQAKLVGSREKVTPRRAPALIKSNDLRFVVANDTCGIPSSQALLAGALIVEEIEGDLFVRCRDGSLRFEIIEFLGDVLTLEVLHHFNFLPPLKHIPRIIVDKLVVHRETWRFTADEVTFALQKDASERFVLARSWARTWGVPRFIFVKTPNEEKPFYVDLASPISIDILAKAIRRMREAQTVETTFKVTEMLPDPNQTWLIDNAGNRYTSELRMVVVDRR